MAQNSLNASIAFIIISTFIVGLYYGAMPSTILAVGCLVFILGLNDATTAIVKAIKETKTKTEDEAATVRMR